VPTDDLRSKVEALAAFGHNQTDISEYLGISKPTLAKHYDRELKTGLVHANFKVASVLFKKATQDEDTTSIIFWLKCRARWRTEEKIGETIEQNDEIKKEIREIRESLKQTHKKEY
jgi:DNA-binding transcriptional ArsR family regulator